MRRICPLLLVVMCVVRPALSAEGKTGRKPIWLVVTRPAFVSVISPLAAQRCRDGFETIISTRPVAKAIADLKRRPAFILLVGDNHPDRQKQPWHVPTRWRKLHRWRLAQREQFASDALWGDLDGDLIPDVPVGRIPVRTPEQLTLVVTKTLKFEDRAPSLNDLRLPVWGGSSGYGPAMDAMASALLIGVVRANAPPWARMWILQADPKNPLCGWPFDQGKMFTGQLQTGGAAAVLMGHASATIFHSMHFNGRTVCYQATDAQEALPAGIPGPPLVILSCESGRFTGPQDCMAESFLLMPGGPPAVIAATTESHPLTNYFSGLCLLRALGGPDKRLGSLWLAAQRQAIKARNPLIERMLRDVEGKLENNINEAALRRDQILMYAILGDPAIRLHLPEKLHGKIKRRADGWYWKVHKPQGAAKLYVGLRPAPQSLPKVEGRLDKAAARRRFQQADATFAFVPLACLDAADEWKGVVHRPGTLRLVATSSRRLYAAAINIKQPTTRPSDTPKKKTQDKQ